MGGSLSIRDHDHPASKINPGRRKGRKDEGRDEGRKKVREGDTEERLWIEDKLLEQTPISPDHCFQSSWVWDSIAHLRCPGYTSYLSHQPPPPTSLSLVLPGGNWYNLCLMRQAPQWLHRSSQLLYMNQRNKDICRKVQAGGSKLSQSLRRICEAIVGIEVMAIGLWNAGSTGNSCISSMDSGSVCAESSLISFGNTNVSSKLDFIPCCRTFLGGGKKKNLEWRGEAHKFLFQFDNF